MRPIHSIVIHHSASSKHTTPKQIEGWHTQRGFDTIGYHAVIWKKANGEWITSPARNEAITGAHCFGFNTGTLGVCITGNYEVEAIEEEAILELLKLLSMWCNKYNILPSNVFGHREKGKTKTACPGRNLFARIATIKQQLTTII